MDNYQLPQEEINNLCNAFGGDAFRPLFKQNPTVYLDPTDLSNDEILELLLDTEMNDIFHNYLNTLITTELNQIRENIEKYKNNGLNRNLRIATALFSSKFLNELDLYVTLSHTEGLTRKDRYEIVQQIAVMKYSIQNAASLTQAQHVLSNPNTTDGNKQAAKSSASKLHESTSDDSTQDMPEDRADDDNENHWLYKLDDSDMLDYVANVADEGIVISLCEVTPKRENGEQWIYRIADLKKNNEFVLYTGTQGRLYNRLWLFLKNGPTTPRTYGIWAWRAEPNSEDSSRDYITSQFQVELKPIQVRRIFQTRTISELANALIAGGLPKPVCSRILYITTISGSTFGVLCNADDLVLKHNGYALSDKCNILPVYQINMQDIIPLGDDVSGLKQLSLGRPDDIYKVKNPLESIKDIVKESLTWSLFKSNGFSHANHKDFKAFIELIPTVDVVAKIEQECCCSRHDAQLLLNSFVDKAHQYIDGESIEHEILEKVIKPVEKLQDSLSNQKQTEAVDNQESKKAEAHLDLVRSQIDKAQQELDSINKQLSTAKNELNDTKNSKDELDQTEAELKQTSEELNAVRLQLQDEQDALSKAKEAHTKILEKAKADDLNQVKEPSAVAAATAPAQNVAAAAMANTQGAITPHVMPSLMPPVELHYQIAPVDQTAATNKELTSWRELLSTLANNLLDAGVSYNERIDCADGLASFLMAAYILKQPLLLVGPNAMDIVEAFSATIDDGRYGVLSCDGQYNPLAVAAIGAGGESIAVINNLLSSSWANRAPEILARKKNVFFIATHPYKEDLQVEPISLYNYMLPVFTEFVVSNYALGNYTYSHKDSNLAAPILPRYSNLNEFEALSQFVGSALIERSIKHLISMARLLVKDEQQIKSQHLPHLLLTMAPLAYASQSMDKLVELIETADNANTPLGSMKQALSYVIE